MTLVGRHNRQLVGLIDKLYWRPVVLSASDDGSVLNYGVWHAYEVDRRRWQGGQKYVSLCLLANRERSGGQKIYRPPAVLRCARCDMAETRLRGVEESMPESVNWREAW